MDKKHQRFLKGMNKDVNPSLQPDDTYRDAVNMDISLQGDEAILNRIKSIAEAMGSGSADRWITPSGGNAVASNILGYTKGIGNLEGTKQDCLIFFTSGINSTFSDQDDIASNIYIYGTTNEKLYAIRDISWDDKLYFQTDGNISAFVTSDRGRSFVYFTDGVNPIRRFQLDSTVFGSYTSAFQLDVVRPAVSDNDLDVNWTDNGSLIAGTYQFSYRLKSSTTGSYTKWSNVSNPFPIIPENAYGGEVGETTNRAFSIVVNISLAEDANYDVIELATIKNTTGQLESQGVVFVSSYAIQGDGSNDFVYDGRQAEFELPIAEVVVDDAPVESAVVGWETNGRTIYGNVSYYDRRLADQEGAIVSASSIIEEVDYSVPVNTEEKRGYFRGEVYRFGIAYHDKYGNWSPVKPLDFSSLKATTPTNTSVNITSITQRERINTNQNTNVVTISTSGGSPSSIFVGDYVRINFGTTLSPDYRYYYVYEKSGTTFFVAAYEDLPTTTLTDVVMTKCLGEDYSHSASNDWKFPTRLDPSYNILGETSNGKAIGLEVVINGLTHPSWATGVGIFRMNRDKNIVYQTPIIPAALRVGVITPGKNTQTQRDYNRDSNGIGEFDHLAPKIFQLGAARGFGVSNVQGSATLNIPPLSYEYPEWRDITSAMERWNIAFAPAPDYVANNLGAPLIPIPDEERMNVNVVDLVGLTRETQPNAAGAKVYTDGNNKDLYFYNGSISNYKVRNDATGNFVALAYPRIQDTIVSIDQVTQQRVFDITNIETDGVYPILQNGAPVELPKRYTSSLNSQAIRLNAGTQLVNQQRTSTNSIPPEAISTFIGDVNPQRSLAIGLTQQLLDPIYQLAKRYRDADYAEVPWSNYVANPSATGPQIPARLTNNDDLDNQLWGMTASIALTAFEDRMEPSNIINGDIANAVFVANIELGKSDFRYGSPNTGQEYIFTGAYSPITDTSNITFSVWGGDCFVTKMKYRVNDSTCIPRIYDPLAGSDVATGSVPTVSPPLTRTVAKTGVSNQQPEFIELYLESEVNFNYISDRDRYPIVNRNILDYTANTLYDYNFGYSIQNNAKRLFSEDRSVEFIAEFPARIIYSDARVLGTNDDGYSRFRALNFKDLEEKYGAIFGLGELPNGDILSFQSMAIRSLPIGKNIVQDENGTTLALQSGVFFPDYISYVTTSYGVQSPRLVTSTESGVFALDKRNGALIKIGEGMKLLQLGRMESYFTSLLSSNQVYADANLSISYDQVAKELHIMGYVPNTNATNWLVYNDKYDSFVSTMDYATTSGSKSLTKPYFVCTIGGKTYLMHTQLNTTYWSGTNSSSLARLGTLRGGNTFGTIMLNTTAVDSALEYVFNEAPDEFKVIDIVGVNSVLPFTSYTVTGHNEGGASETTGVQTGSIQQRNGMTFAPLIRDSVSQGRVRGVFAIIRLAFNQTNAANKIYSAFTQFRKSFR